jgi:hypothetical protein
MNITVYSANNYRHYYMHLIVSYENGGNELFVFVFAFVTILFSIQGMQEPVVEKYRSNSKHQRKQKNN